MPTPDTAASEGGQRPVLALIRGGNTEAECCCGEPDVYDGYAVCEVHPDGN